MSISKTSRYSRQDKIKALNAIHDNLEVIWDSIEDAPDNSYRDRGRFLYSGVVELMSELDWLLDPR